MATPALPTPVPPAGPDPSLVPAEPGMTTIIENGRTVILPIQQANTHIVDQSVDPGWGFTPFGPTSEAVLPAVPTVAPPTVFPPVPASVPPAVQPADPATSLVPAPAETLIVSTPPAVIPVISEVPVAGTRNENSPATSEPVVLPPPAMTSRPPTEAVPPKNDAIDPAVPVPHVASSTQPDIFLNPTLPTSTSTRPPQVPSLTSTRAREDPTDFQPSRRPADFDHPTSLSTTHVASTTGSSDDVVFIRPSSSAAPGASSSIEQGNGLLPDPGTSGTVTKPPPTSTSASFGGLLPITSQARAVEGGLVAAQDPISSSTSSLLVNAATPLIGPPAPGSSEESTIIALVSSSVTLSGSAAVAAIASGASQLDSKGQVIKSDKDKPALNSFAIAGIVAGGLLLIIILSAIWYRWRKKNQAKHEKGDPDMAEVARPDTGFDFTDDPVTASTGRIQRMTMNGLSEGQDPFHDRHRSHYGAQSWYQPEVDDMYEYPRADNAAHSHVGYSSQPCKPDPLDQLYGSAIEEEQSRRELSNPFAPPVPPVPASLRQSVASRPATQFTDIYGAYESRPTTQISATPHLAYDEDDDRDPPAATPATSSLLPWLTKKKGNTNPTPSVPALPRPLVPHIPNDLPQSVGSRGLDRQYTTYESNAAGVGARKGGMQKLARPVMAQTPAGAGANEFNVMIPGFR